MKNITVGQLIEKLNGLDKDTIIGIMDADTQWFMEITAIYEAEYNGKKAYAIGDSSYCGDCKYMDNEKEIISFGGDEK